MVDMSLLDTKKEPILKEEKKENKPKRERNTERPKQMDNLKDIKENVRRVTQDVIRRYGGKKSSYVLENDIPVLLGKYNWKVIVNDKGKKEVVDNENSSK